MGTSMRVRASDIADIHQLLGECRELWADADAWQHHLVRGACRLTGVAVGAYTESSLSRDRSSTEIYDEVDTGWRDAAARSHRVRLLVEHPDRVAYLQRCYRLAGLALDSPEGEATVVRAEMRDDTDWYRSGIYNEYYRPAYVDGFVLSFAVNRHTGNLIALHVCQDIADRAPGMRTKGIVALLNRQFAPLVGVVLSTRRQRGLRGLTRRLRQTLDALLDGESEKQVAARLGLSGPTVHEYVGALYRHFGVTSRAELMAYFVHRRPQLASQPIANGRSWPAPTMSRLA